jgi:signal transduction histidine kinase/ligand-binding sensor domain-containing protein/DNA-binding NarL/FixJ family response regulator
MSLRLKYKMLIFACGMLFLTFPYLVQAINTVQFHNLNEEYNISIREANSVCEDGNGFIWISSKMGILRYSPDDIRSYQLPLETADILTITLVFEMGQLYAYSNNGQIFRFNPISNCFEMLVNLRTELRNSNLLVTQLLVDLQGTLWIASTYGIYSYNKEIGIKSLENSENIHDSEWYDETSFLYAIEGQIKRFNIETNSSETYFVYPLGQNYQATSLILDKETNTLWMGTFANGLFFLKTQNGQLKLRKVAGVPCQPILAIEEISDSTFLAGIDGQGIWEVRKSDGKILQIFKEDSDNPNSLKGNGVYDVYCDKNKRVWISTYSGGATYFDQTNPVISQIRHMVNNSNSLGNNDVNGILEDSKGGLWFATNNGISRWNLKNNQWSSFYTDNKDHAQVFLSLLEDTQGHIWAGTYSSGVYLLDRETGKELAHYSTETTNGKFDNNYIFDIFQDVKGDIWMGGVRGDLICYHPKTNSFQSFNDFSIKAIVDYGADNFLMASTFGLVLFDKNTGKNEILVKGYLVQDILLKDDVVWLATIGDGLIRYNLKTKQSKEYTFDTGLSSNFVNSIEFASGHFWIGTEHGLCKLDEKTEQITTFNSMPELSAVSINQGAFYRLRNGKLIWGTNKGAVIFDQNEIHPTHEEGKIFFQDLTISGRSIRELPNFKMNMPLDSLHEIDLKYFQNTISLELIPIQVQASGSKFSWKVDELDTEWSKPSDNRFLSYSNFSSGNYTLQIRMLNNSLTSVLAERSLKLNVIPPIWERWWFRLMLFSFMLGVGLFLFLYYIDHLKKRHSEDKIRFFANTAHEIRTAVTLISGPIEELNKQPELSDNALHYLYLATEQSQRLVKVVTQLMDFQKVDIQKERLSISMVNLVKSIEDRLMMFESYANHQNIDLTFHTNCKEYYTRIDEGMIEKVVDNLISNAIKYSHAGGQVNVTLNCSPTKWIFEVKDQGIGISKRAQRLLFREYYRSENAVNSKIVGSGIGLLLVNSYVKLHRGKINCTSQKNIGSTFQVVIPYTAIENVKIEETPPINCSPLHNAPKNQIPVNKGSSSNDSFPKTLKVLIVEDNDYLREFLQSAMESHFQIRLADNGETAWQLIQKEVPDLVVSDIMMPNMDGFELCQLIKSTYESSHIPVILLTSLSGKAQQLKGLGLGADDYITKPFDITVLQQRIKSIILNRQTTREKALKIINFDEHEPLLSNELNDKFLKRMVEVVHKNLDNSQFSKNDFAEEMNVSPSLLYKKIKSLTDQSPTDFIKAIRLDHALELLRSKNYTITEISELCGFASVGYFSTVFRKHYGKSPTQIGSA